MFERSGILGSPTECRARLTVFFISIAIVIGPTPPGTGVMADATVLTASKSTSPTMRYPRFLVASGRSLMPTSITTAPGLIYRIAHSGMLKPMHD